VFERHVIDKESTKVFFCFSTCLGLSVSSRVARINHKSALLDFLVFDFEYKLESKQSIKEYVANVHISIGTRNEYFNLGSGICCFASKRAATV